MRPGASGGDARIIGQIDDDRLVEFVRKPEILGYYAQFESDGRPRPEPGDILACKMNKGDVTIG